MADPNKTFALLFLYSLLDLDYHYKRIGLDPIIITDAEEGEMTFFSTPEIIHNAIGMLKTDCPSMAGLYEDGDFYEYSKTPAYQLLLKTPDYLSNDGFSDDDHFSIIGLNDIQNKHDIEHDGYFSITTTGLLEMSVLYTDLKDDDFTMETFKQSTIDGLTHFYQNSGIFKDIVDNANEMRDSALKLDSINADRTFDLLFLYSLLDLKTSYDRSNSNVLFLYDKSKDKNDPDSFVGSYFPLQEIVDHALDMLKPDCNYLTIPGITASAVTNLASSYLYQSSETLITNNDTPCISLASDLDPKFPAGYFDINLAGVRYMGVLCSNFEGNGIDLEAFKQSTIDGLNYFYQNNAYGKSLIEDHIPVDGPVDPFEKS